MKLQNIKRDFKKKIKTIHNLFLCQITLSLLFFIVLFFQQDAVIADELKDEKEWISKLSQSTQSNKGEFYKDLGYFYRNRKQNQKSVACFEKALIYKPQDESLYPLIGEYYMTLEKWDKSLQIFEKGIRVHPENSSYLTNIVRICYQLEDSDKIQFYFLNYERYHIPEISVLQAKLIYYQLLHDSDSLIMTVKEIMERYPNHEMALLMCANALKEMNDDLNLLTVRGLLFQYNPGNEFNRMEYAKLLNETGKYEDALVLLTEKNLNQEIFSDENYDYIFELMRSYYGLNQWEKTVDTYLRFYRKYAICCEISDVASDLLDMFRTNPSALTTVLQKKISLDPENPDYYILLVQSYSKENRKDNARRIAQTGSVKFPREQFFGKWMAQDLREQNKLESAIALYWQMNLEDPSDNEILYHLADIYNEQKNYGLAIQCYQSLLTTERNLDENYEFIISLYFKSGDLDKVEKTMNEFINKYDYKDFVYIRAAYIYMNEGWNEKALSLLKEGIQYFPDNLELLELYTTCLHQLGRDSELEPWLNKMISLCSYSAEKLRQQANFIENVLQQPEKSLEIYQLAIELEPDFYNNHLAYARALSRQNQIDESVKVYRKILDLTSGLTRKRIANEYFQLIQKHYPVRTVKYQLRWLNHKYPHLNLDTTNSSLSLTQLTNNSR